MIGFRTHNASIHNEGSCIVEMGEAKRRKQAGLAPKTTKKDKKSSSLNLLTKYPSLPLYAGLLFAVYLIIDWIRLNAVGR